MIRRNEDGSASADRRRRSRTSLNALLTHYRGECADTGEQELVDALFLDAGQRDTTGLLTGISELSVSFHGGRPVAIRALSEVLRRQRLDTTLALAGRQWGMDMLRRVSGCATSCYAIPLFCEVYEMLYLHDKAEPAPLFRFGIAVQFGGVSRVLKMYFDLHAVNERDRRRSLEHIADLLDKTSGLESWRRVCPGVDIDKSRVVGVDFGVGNAVRVKFYWGARHLTWDAIGASAREMSGGGHRETLNRLEREVCSVDGALSSVLVSMCAANRSRSIKVDVCVARVFENDGQACKAIQRFMGPSVDCTQVFRHVSGGLDPSRTKCIQQYLGVELLPDGDSRVTLYYRPIGLETEHLNAAIQPRMCG